MLDMFPMGYFMFPMGYFMFPMRYFMDSHFV